MDEHFDVAVVGAGFSGTSLAVHLLQRMPAGSRIALIGPAGEVGRGLAYRAPNPDLILNVRAARMSLYPDDDAHFVRWLAEKSAGGTPKAPAELAESYVTRASYGRYLRQSLLDAVERTKHRIDLEIIEAPAASLVRREGEWKLRLENGREIAATGVALCLGNAAGRFPRLPAAIDPAARENMIADPWNDDRFRAIPPEARVLFVGTGLTMVDLALTLRRRGHSGPLTAVSRHGLLPQPHSETATPPADLAPFLRDRPLVTVFRAVVRAARRAEANGRDWRAVMEGLRPVTQELWQGLGHSDRRRFLRHVEAYWSSHRHRMAPHVARRIAALRDGGQLRIRAGRLLSVETGSSALKVALRDRKTRAVETLRIDWIVNCTGPGKTGGLLGLPFVSLMVDQGLVRGDSLHLGLDVDAESVPIGRHGEPTPGLFALGPLAMGQFFEITAVREIRAQAAEIADRLAAAKVEELFPRGTPRRSADGPRIESA